MGEYDSIILKSPIESAVEIAREGREGRRIGTLFTLGDGQTLPEKSRPLILDPLAGHPYSLRHVRDANLRGTIKELVQLDGAFVAVMMVSFYRHAAIWTRSPHKPVTS